MTALSGFDSAFGPTAYAAGQAKLAGATFWFGYLGGPGVYHAWTSTEWAVLRATALTPGCLWVPTYGLAEDPVQAASRAVALAESYGLFGAVMLDTEQAMATSSHVHTYVDGFYHTVTAAGRACPIYTGAHYLPAGAPNYAPNWGSGLPPAAGNCIQYGPANRYGMSVDVNLADPAFPLASWSKPATPAPGRPGAVPSPITGEQMICTDPDTGGVWVVATKEGAVFTYDGAPYIGATNNTQMNAKKYPCVGLDVWPDHQGKHGLVMVLDWGDRGDGRAPDGGERFRRYHFPRNGSGKATAGTY